MLNQDADTSSLMMAPGCHISLPTPEKTAAEKCAEKAAWDSIFNHDGKTAVKAKPATKAKLKKPKRRKRRRKRRKRKKASKHNAAAWSDEQRANWARVHYQHNHGPGPCDATCPLCKAAKAARKPDTGTQPSMGKWDSAAFGCYWTSALTSVV